MGCWYAVPKPHSTKFRLIVDHSAGTHSLNSMIDRDLIAGIKMDGIQSLGRSLLDFRAKHPHEQLVLFKSDVSAAFRRMPVHPLWQLKQVVTVDGNRHVDRNVNFGNSGSPKIWVSFMSSESGSWKSGTVVRRRFAMLETWSKSASFGAGGELRRPEPLATGEACRRAERLFFR
ncbi:hypothetical protein PAXRUDRAFT_662357 [Paxillus rubicundulus Ve08.2h10]|uniref:Unplaced genomic scaffold scaffold_644, whole genome shotgun sequence n=1 Tax=Paxillus rubicundulus Ve08.2h10 TaxID=930991 RepID=A0A0D0E246_9AGAM|nr:hypothetical protein PAXRUDRAFT_662357 [Paxillus rubicundulus Ve08.2h10]